MFKKLAISGFSLFLILLLSACGEATFSRRTVSEPPACQSFIQGKIASITKGSPSYVTIKKVYESLNNHCGGSHQYVKKTIKIPAGHFVSSKHWQSNDHKYNLFIGNRLTFFPKTGGMMDDANPVPLNLGLVKKVSQKGIEVQRLKSVSTTKMKLMNKTITFHSAPYTRISVNYKVTHNLKKIKPGEVMFIDLEGLPQEYIAKQIDYYSSPKVRGWTIKHK